MDTLQAAIRAFKLNMPKIIFGSIIPGRRQNSLNYQACSHLPFTDGSLSFTDTFETLETFDIKIVSSIKNVFTFDPEFKKQVNGRSKN
jgi:hypothetical protein